MPRFPLLLCLLPAAAFAQQASVQGVAADRSGALIPDVEITVQNIATGVKLTARTNQEGFYSVPFLNPGTYTASAAKSGFSTVTRDNIKLDVGQSVRADFTLEVGSLTQTLEVSAAATLIDAQTTVVGQVIDNKRVVELPLNGRNYLELAQLTAGVAPARGSRMSGAGAFSSTGNHGAQTIVMLDGVDNSSRMSGGLLGNQAQLVTPPIDSVAEFKVVTNNNSAEYGFRMGGTVIVTTKAGGNELHGSLYEFLRNEKLDGANFFAVGRPKPSFRQNQFGATAGGPVRRNQTFFFASYEGLRAREGLSRISTVPTAAYRAGDFTGARPLYDWATTRRNDAGQFIRDPFAGNRIPAARFDRVTARLVQLYPEQNSAGVVNNFFFSPVRKRTQNQLDGRVDHLFTNNHRAFFRYSRRTFDFLTPGPLPLPADGGDWDTEVMEAHSGVVNLSSTLSPTMTNELRFGVSRADTTRDIPYDRSLNEEYGITGIPNLGTYNQRGMARFAPSGYATLGAETFWPNNNNLGLAQVSDTLLTIRGRHMFKTGFEFRRERLFRRAARFARGFFGFNAAFTQNPLDRGRTGDGLADFLLGTANTSTLGNPNGEVPVTMNWSAFFQDDWRITNKLTLNLGVRWDLFGPPSFRDLQETPVSNFLFQYGSQDYTIVRPKDEGDCGCDLDRNNFAPRLGLAYQLTPRTVLRSGFGILYGAPDAISFFGDARFQNLPPEFTEITFPSDSLLTPSRIVAQGFPTGIIPSRTVQENVFVNTADRFMPSQYSMQWFFDVQRELPFDTLLTLSYLGNGGRQLVQVRDVNQPLTPGPGSLKSRSPWPFFAAILYRHPGANSSYQGMTAKVEKRYSRGLSLLTAYTWSKSINNASEALAAVGGQELQDNYDLKRHRGNSTYDTRHVFVSSAIYDLPFGKGRAFLNRTGPLDWVLGGWQAGGILTLRTGAWFTPLVRADISNTGTLNPTGGVSIRNHPNRLRDGNLPAAERTIDRWFDVSAFAIPANFTYGSAGRNILTGPGLRNLDLKIGKNFTFGENKAKRIEFRTEFFNASNTPNFGQPANQIDVAGVGTIRSAGSPRQIQFGLKFIF